MLMTMFAKSMEQNRMVEIIYMSESGVITQRKIQVLSIEEDRIRAFCYLRQLKRTFKVSNILSAQLLTYKQRLG
ncbi:hypothetical protein MHI18_16350 [Peribacillus sp. FSL H8-0477]|uniref:hypothetical protein n=1 Tax=Peribacillus sp. FSL H8-0477 TaxID=2921388 RepID=UPI0030FBA574